MLVILTLSLLIFILIIIAQCYSKKNKDFKIFLAKCILCTIFLELTIFNINYYRVSLSNYQEIKYNKNTIKTDLTKDGSKQIKLDNINQNVKSIYIEFENCYKEDYEIYYSDETTISRFLGTKTYMKDVNKTRYTVVSLSRKS